MMRMLTGYMSYVDLIMAYWYNRKNNYIKMIYKIYKWYNFIDNLILFNYIYILIKQDNDHNSILINLFYYQIPLIYSPYIDKKLHFPFISSF